MQNKVIFEKAKEIKVIEEVDVLVVGGGPSGVAAALGAAKAGAKTMVVEALGSFGGMWTNGMVITLAGFNNWLRPYQRVVKGVIGKWIERAFELGGVENNRSWVLNSDAEIMKYVADQLLLEHNITCLLHSWMADVIIENNEIKGVFVENVDGRSAILAKTIVDCTGNGDVFARAGEDFNISDELQPMTLPFYVGDMNPSVKDGFKKELVIPMGPEPGYLTEEILLNYTSRRNDVAIDKDKLKSAALQGQIPNFGGPWFGGLRTNSVWMNTTRVYGSAVSATELTKAEMEARSDVHSLIRFYKKEFNDFKDAWLLKTAPTIGIRETRRLDGVYTITGEDVVNCRKFDDAIALGTWPIDIHPPKGESGMHKMFIPRPYQIPYRSLLPKRIDGLIVAGRCISADREANGSLRVGATCGAIGHAAGVAAALSSLLKILPRMLDYRLVQNEIISQQGLISLNV